MSIESILSELVIKTAGHFGLESSEALAAVAQSRLADELCSHGNLRNLTIDQLCSELFDEIARAE